MQLMILPHTAIVIRQEVSAMYEITADNVDLFAFSNSERLRNRAIRGIAIEFHGLGGGMELRTESPRAEMFADAAILYVYPYYGPWSWMNDVAIRMVDGVLDALIARHALAPEISVVSTGGSMGGLSCLVFARYSRHNIVACAANCPVCDLPYHYGERPDLPRTLHMAFGHYACSLAAAMKSASPIHLAPTMPPIAYYIVHGTADTLVDKAAHSDRFVAQMRKCGHDVTYAEIPGMPHCELTPEAKKNYDEFIFRSLS